MATTQEILSEAKALGEKIAEHGAAKKFEEAVKALQDDVEAQRLLTDYQRFVTTIAEKEQQGKPIEVEDKHKLDELQKGVMRNANLRTFQMAQMDYLDLMRQVDAAISGVSENAPPAAAAASPLVNPDLSE